MNKTALGKLFPALCRRSYSYKSIRRPQLQNLIVPKDQKTPTPSSNGATNLTQQIRAKILATGPITVAEYMREVLTHPSSGYYMNRDVFGRAGDFITSPEISQIFGELVAVWIFMEWQKVGAPAPLQIIELGPGRGTLARDVLNVLARFKVIGQFSMHFVEVSPHLSELQARLLCYKHDDVKESDAEAGGCYKRGCTVAGTELFWYKRLEDVPQEFSVVLAHEFFDALPTHKLQLDANGVWKEILIDVQDTEAAKDTFRFVLSKGQTPISQLFKPIPGDTRECLEYSLESDRIVGLIAERMESDGGFGLLMDYGHYGEKTDTFRAFRKHALHDPLVAPGSADLTADVDFRQLQRVAEKSEVYCFGPVEQGLFLQRMEGEARLEQLLLKARPEQQEALKSGYAMLTEPNQMGKRFKFLAMFPTVLKDHLAAFPVHGFH